MILDEKLEFADALDVSAAAGTALVGDVVDMDTTGRGLRTSPSQMNLVIQVTTAFASAGAATVQFVLASDAGAAIAADGTETRHALTAAIGIASLTAGAQIIIPIPYGSLPTAERYLGVEVITAAATTTAGSINAFLTMDADDWRALPDAQN